jgi:outer membrane immunogenic protein
MLNRSMKKTKGAVAAAIALTALSAQAADITSSGGLKDVPVYTPIYAWTGFYFGVNGGYASSNGGRTLSTSTDWVFADEGGPQSGTFDSTIGKVASSGGFGGGQLGYNVQHGSFVFGLEIDAQASNVNGKTATSIDASGLLEGLTINAAAKSELDWFATLRARLGYAAGPLLLYATGGFAVGGVKDSLWLSSSPNFGSFAFSNNETRAGYTVGGGVEYLISLSWSLKAEYQYIDLGSSRIRGTVLSTDNETYVAAGDLSTSRIDHTYNTVRAGLNYHINQVYEPLK